MLTFLTENGIWKFIELSTEFLDFDKRLSVIPKIINKRLDGFFGKWRIDLRQSIFITRKNLKEREHNVIVEKILI